ncbi:MAG: hypothetical protein IT244_09700 [Bacteroidia bacterium]|nr:hypothetical protein [Bacteroidia bacterium]
MNLPLNYFYLSCQQVLIFEEIATEAAQAEKPQDNGTAAAGWQPNKLNSYFTVMVMVLLILTP